MTTWKFWKRPDWPEYFLDMAETVSERADCTRRNVGAVIAKDNRIVATGYNGAPSGEGSCLEGDCPRGKHYKVSYTNHHDFDSVGCGTCGNLGWPCNASVEPGSSYDTGAGSCIAVHAELNALLYADRDKCEGASIYVTAVAADIRDGKRYNNRRVSGEPCGGCMRAIKGAGIAHAVWTLDYDKTGTWDR